MRCPQSVLEIVVHEHFGGDAVAALVDLVIRFGIADEAIAEMTQSTHP